MQGEPLIPHRSPQATVGYVPKPYVVQWSYGPVDQGALAKLRDYRYRIIRNAKGVQDAVKKFWQVDVRSIEKAPPDRQVMVHRVFPFTHRKNL